MILDEIELQVTQRVNQMPEAVFGLLFDKVKRQHVKTSHRETCDCDYCTALRQYTRTKIGLHHAVKRLSWDDLEVHGAGRLAEKVEWLSFQASLLRKLKNTAKEKNV